MTSETANFIEKAEKLLVNANTMLNVGLNSDAGRTAYLAGFHAAQALIFERMGKTVKTHKGVQMEFMRLTKNEPSVPAELRIFLSQAYNLKAIALQPPRKGRGEAPRPERSPLDPIMLNLRLLQKYLQ
ncbi:MAG: HEPN domain-containing protein [Magnetococcales bacterium]|uniref:HEPN domain-containing protein n=1 Tax=Candidatus Magnetobacterium casense TaxID=1455061 RepID=A0ABS6RYR0_9BACT|nr:HEPN domain-containing protein [Candidatus Magnetobacterium casensis]MBF0609270.1 HEPN domain-containing protein [Nitrospirota bacterium]MBV6341787.1 HEPN domain-containing protein [Candidatus Magnetobacterium casensis]